MIASGLRTGVKVAAVFLVLVFVQQVSSYAMWKYNFTLPIDDKLAFLIMGALIGFSGTRVYYRKKLGLE